MGTMMKGIMKRTQAVHFSKPVDWKKMGLHEYPRIVKQPMDLGTVQERLARHHYTRLEELALDCRLVWKNAFLFNGPESVYFKAAKALSDAFEKKLEEIEREAEQINNPQLDTMERCRILLDDMTLNPFSEWFREPVDHENMGLTDYLQVIKEPQDLGTISKKLERTHYMSPEDYARDVRLVWQNAITYNSATSMFGVVAAILWQTFDRRFALITNLASVDPGRPIPDRPGWPNFQQGDGVGPAEDEVGEGRALKAARLCSTWAAACAPGFLAWPGLRAAPSHVPSPQRPLRLRSVL